MSKEHELMAYRLRFCGALLFFLSSLSGWFILGAVRGQFPADADVVGQAHITGYLGCFWLMAIAYTLPYLKMGETAHFLLYRMSIMAALSKWVLTLGRGILGVEATMLTGDNGNDALFILNQILVVIPTFVSAVIWMKGLAAPSRSPRAGESTEDEVTS